MKKTIFTTNYITSYYPNEQLAQGEVMPQTYAMAWCMYATKIHRIFNVDELKEFLFRLAITLETLEVTENWFAKDKLFRFRFNDGMYNFSTNDIINHFGFEALNHYENMQLREDYFSSVDKGIINSIIINDFTNDNKLTILTLKDGETLDTIVKQYVPVITPKLIKKADFFANDIQKFLPNQIFSNLSPELHQKQKELEKRREAIRNLPVFDIGKIPTGTIEQCLKAMYTNEYVDELMANPALFQKDGKPFIYLAWLYANDLLVYQDYDYVPIEGINLNIEDYYIDKYGCNLEVTISDMNFDEIVPLLKGLFL